MNKTCTVSYWLLLPAIALITISNSLFAADCPSDISAVTDGDADVSVEILTHQVKPLTKCELEVEAQAWLGLLQKKVAEISNAQIAAIYKEDEIHAVKEAADALEDVKDAEQDASSEDKVEAASEAKQALQEVKEAEKKPAQNITWQEAMEKNTQFIVKEFKDIQKEIINLKAEIDNLNNKIKNLKLAPPIPPPEAKTEKSKQKQPETKEKHPKQGDCQPEDYSVEKYFYYGNK